MNKQEPTYAYASLKQFLAVLRLNGIKVTYLKGKENGTKTDR